MIKKIITSTLVSGSVLLAAQASATIFDFVDLTDTSNGEISGVMADGTAHALGNSNERAFQYFDWEKDGITLTTSASYTGSATYGDSYTTAYSQGDDLTAWAYLDQGNAGLGVCSKGLKTDGKGTNQCNPGSDDNVTEFEVLQMTFDQLVDVDFSQTVFRDGGHHVFTPDIDISLDGGSSWGMLDTNATLTSDSYFFRTNVVHSTNQFYIDSIAATSNVPEPTSLALFSLGLLGLGFARKRAST